MKMQSSLQQRFPVAVGKTTTTDHILEDLHGRHCRWGIGTIQMEYPFSCHPYIYSLPTGK